jgi:hypothetical protein
MGEKERNEQGGGDRARTASRQSGLRREPGTRMARAGAETHVGELGLVTREASVLLS